MSRLLASFVVSLVVVSGSGHSASDLVVPVAAAAAQLESVGQIVFPTSGSTTGGRAGSGT